MTAKACKEIICIEKALAILDSMANVLKDAKKKSKNDDSLKDDNILKAEFVIEKIEPLIYEVDLVSAPRE